MEELKHALDDEMGQDLIVRGLEERFEELTRKV
jgi:hypothetical protein